MSNLIDPYPHKHLNKKRNRKKKVFFLIDLHSGKSDVRQVEFTESEDNRC
jgi:hypothetical protein